MAQALLGGLLASKADPTALRVSDPSPTCRDALSALGPIALFEDNAAAVEGAEAVVLAVKPQVLGPVLMALAPTLAAQPNHTLRAIHRRRHRLRKPAPLERRGTGRARHA